MQENTNYVKLSNAFSNLPLSIDPGTITENEQKDSSNTNNQTKNDQKKKDLTKLAKKFGALNKHQRKLARRSIAKQQAKLKATKEDDYIDYHVGWAEDDRTTIAKENNNKLKMWKQVLQKNPTKKVGIIQSSKNKAYTISNTLGRALLSTFQPNKKKVTFANEDSVRTFNKNNKPIVSAIYDSGADRNYMTEEDRKKLNMPILRKSNKKVLVANGGISSGKYEVQIPLKNFSNKATKADTFDNFNSSLISVSQLAEDETTSVFTNKGVAVYKDEDILITCKGEPLLIGVRDRNGRYRIPLVQTRGQWQPRKPSKKAKRILREANSVYDLPSTEQAIKWMHAVCGYPVKSTWLKAVKAGNYVGWPMLTEKNVNKYYPETKETPKGHMAQSRKNKRSTKAKPMKEHKSTQLIGKKERDVYIKVCDAKETIYSDQTGAMPTRSQSGNKYIMVLVEIDSNAILVEPMKSRKDAEMIRAYDALMLRLNRANIYPKKHVLDNEVSENMKNHIRDTYKLTMELVPPGCHRRNAAEVAIRNFKAHFLSILAGVADDFPNNLWDKLLPQAEVTLNLIRQSNATPNVSAYAHLCGPFDYNKMPLAPMGCEAQIHEKSDKRGTWEYHSIDGWYVRTSPEHYRAHICVAKQTKSERCTDTVQFQHKDITNPTLTAGDKLMKAIADCMQSIKKKGKATTQQEKDLLRIMRNTKQVVSSNQDDMELPAGNSNDAPVPRVQQMAKDQVVPRVETNNIESNNKRITRSMSKDNNNNNTNNATQPLPRVSSSNSNNNNTNNVTQPLPRVSSSNGSNNSRPLRIIKSRVKQLLLTATPERVNEGPAMRTRSKLKEKITAEEPPANRTRSKATKLNKPITSAKRISKLRKPSQVPNHLRPTKASTARTSKQGAANAVSRLLRGTGSIKGSRINKRLQRLEAEVHQALAVMDNERHQALAVMDKETGKMLNYRNLMRLPKYKKIWERSSANEFGRLANGVGGRIKGTNTIKFIMENEVPQQRKKDVTYGQFVCTIRPEKEEQERTRFTVGGDKINYPGEVATPTADMLVAKMLMNSVISTKGAKFMTMDISNFYLMTPLKRPEYVKIKISDIPAEIIKEYELNDKVTEKGYIYIQANRGMYGLPQSGLLANQLLEKRLNKHGYFQSKLVPGLWAHKTRPIQFTLVVDDFGVKYVGKEHALHLQSVLEEHYKITQDWTGAKYIGLTIDWDYARGQVHLSMPGYVAKALKQFQYQWDGKRQDAPFPSAPIQYGAKQQYATQESQAPALDKAGKKFIQQVCGKFLFLGRAVDSTLLCPISAIASQSANPTEDTMKHTKQLLKYLASQEEAVLTFNASDMILAAHSDASYLSEPNARSRAGGHFFLSNNSNIPPNNGAVLNIAHIIKHVMTSATEAELAALYINAREAVYMRIILEEMGHKQPATPLQTDNAMADAVINGKIQPKRTKAMDMRFHWLRDRECQEQFRIYWRPGKLNYADYWTKHHAAKHHKNVRKEFLTPYVVVEMLRQASKGAAAA